MLLVVRPHQNGSSSRGLRVRDCGNGACSAREIARTGSSRAPLRLAPTQPYPSNLFHEERGPAVSFKNLEMSQMNMRGMRQAGKSSFVAEPPKLDLAEWDLGVAAVRIKLPAIDCPQERRHPVIKTESSLERPSWCWRSPGATGDQGPKDGMGWLHRHARGW